MIQLGRRGVPPHRPPLVRKGEPPHADSEKPVARSGGASPRTILVVLLAGGLIFGLLAWWATHAVLQGQLRGLERCRGRYAVAHSFPDTNAVDMTYPTPDGLRSPSARPGARTCGDLRLAGRLR
jgi:hypothetical protein